MIKKVLIVLCLAIMLSSGVIAATQIRPVNVKMGVNFIDNNAFKLILPGGTEKYFTWGDNETHTDSIFNHTIFYEYDESTWCSSYSELGQQINQLDNKLNQSVECAVAKAERAEYLRIKEIEEELRVKYETESNKLTNLTQKLNNELLTCQSSLESFKSYKTGLNECEEELDEKKNAVILWFMVGLGIGYGLWGRKKKRGPSEQSELGFGGDDVREDIDDTPFE